MINHSGAFNDSGPKSEESQNGNSHDNAVAKAHEAHQQSMDKLFEEIHSKPKGGDGLAKGLAQYQKSQYGDGVEFSEDLKAKVAPNEGHKTVLNMVDSTNGTTLSVTMAGKRDREDALDVIISAAHHVRMSLRNEAAVEQSVEPVEANDEPDPIPNPDDLPDMRVQVSLPSFSPYDDIPILVSDAFGTTEMQIIDSRGKVVASQKATVVGEHEFCFDYIDTNIPAGSYIARCTDFFDRVCESGWFEVKRDTLRSIKNFCRVTGWGYSTVHKAINDGTIPAHLVVQKSKTCNKRRVRMSADQALLNAGKRKCRKHKRPNRRAKVV